MNARRRSQLRQYQSRSFGERRRRRASIGVAASIVAAVFWIFALARFSSLGYFSIDAIQVYGADPDIVPTVQSAASAALRGSYIGVFSKSNVFMFPRKSVANAVIASSPRITSADVRRDGWHTLIVSVSEKAPAALVCAGLPDFDASGALSDDDDCYAADATGLMFEKMPAVASDGYDRYYAPDISDDAAIGSLATSTAEFAALQSFVSGVKTLGIKPEGLLVKDGGDYELYVENPGAVPGPASLAIIYFNDLAGFPTELTDLQAFWPHMTASSTASGATLGFQYIDLRYGSNVFYR